MTNSTKATPKPETQKPDEMRDANVAALPTAKDPHEERRQRVQRCSEELSKLLAKHRCEIHAYLLPLEQVGTGGDKAQIAAAWGLHPHE